MVYIRKAKESDLLLMKNIFKIKELGLDKKAHYSKYIQRLIKSKKGSVILVAEDSSKIIGLIFGEYNQQENWAELGGVGILQGHRGQGIGSKLIKEFENIIKSKNINNIELFAHIDTLAKHIHKLGYEKGETYINYKKKL